MQKMRPQKPEVPVLQMVLFGLGVALLAIINSCGYNTLKVAHALPAKAKALITGSLETAVLTSQLHEKHTVTLTLKSASYSGPVDIRIWSPEIQKLDLQKAVKISALPRTVTLTAGGEVDVAISVDVGAAPVIDDKHFRILIFKGGTKEIIYRTEVDLNVLPSVASH